MPLLKWDSTFSIACSDAEPFDASVEDLQGFFESLRKTSVFADVWTKLRIGCRCVLHIGSFVVC